MDGPRGDATCVSFLSAACSPQQGHAQQPSLTGGSPSLPAAVVLWCDRVALWKGAGAFSGSGGRDSNDLPECPGALSRLCWAHRRPRRPPPFYKNLKKKKKSLLSTNSLL